MTHLKFNRVGTKGRRASLNLQQLIVAAVLLFITACASSGPTAGDYTRAFFRGYAEAAEVKPCEEIRPPTSCYRSGRYLYCNNGQTIYIY